MDLQTLKTYSRKYCFYYAVVISAILGMKYFYSRAGSDQLLWILAPTAWLVSKIGSISFLYQPGIGYINHELRFIIAPSCSGVQFLMVLFAVLGISFLGRIEETPLRFTNRLIDKKWSWLAFSTAGSYIVTILVNSVRIVLSIYLPGLFSRIGLLNEGFRHRLLTPQRLHSLIGIVVYFSALLVIYQVTGRLLSSLSDTPDAHANVPLSNGSSSSVLRPLFWYLLIVLGIPLLNRVYRFVRELIIPNGGTVHLTEQVTGQGFVEYALLIMGACLAVISLFLLFSALHNRLGTGRKNKDRSVQL